MRGGAGARPGGPAAAAWRGARGPRGRAAAALSCNSTRSSRERTWSMSPCVADTVWSRSRILSVSQSTWQRRVGGRGRGVEGSGGRQRQPQGAPPRAASASAAAARRAPAAAPARAGGSSRRRAEAAAAGGGQARRAGGGGAHLAAGVGEDDGLGDGQRLVQVAQRVQLPVLALLLVGGRGGRGEGEGGGRGRHAQGGSRRRLLAAAPAAAAPRVLHAAAASRAGPASPRPSTHHVDVELLDTLQGQLVALDQNAHLAEASRGGEGGTRAATA